MFTVKNFVFIAITFNLINLITGLKCHACLESSTSSCANGIKESFYTNICYAEDEALEAFCMQTLYADAEGEPVYQRECSSGPKGIDHCEGQNYTSCSWCTEDFCNDKPNQK